MNIIEYDIKMTFLYGDLHEEIFMKELHSYMKLKIKQFFLSSLQEHLWALLACSTMERQV